jgi:GNAT superfamily N-acetyltransferase
LVIEPLSATHKRKEFDCGNDAVSRFLRENALQDATKDLSRTMVMVDYPDDMTGIVGYYTILISQVAQEQIPNDKPKITRPIPVVWLGQIGVDRAFQNKGLGETLLMDVQARVHEISQRVGIRALMLDAQTEQLAHWYERYDFKRFTGQLRLFKSIEAIRKLGLYPLVGR